MLLRWCVLYSPSEPSVGARPDLAPFPPPPPVPPNLPFASLLLLAAPSSSPTFTPTATGQRPDAQVGQEAVRGRQCRSRRVDVRRPARARVHHVRRFSCSPHPDAPFADAGTFSQRQARLPGAGRDDRRPDQADARLRPALARPRALVRQHEEARAQAHRYRLVGRARCVCFPCLSRFRRPSPS